MTVQTNVLSAAPIGVPGKEYDCSFSDVVTKIATENIPFGAWVGFTADGVCELPDSAGEVTGAAGGGIALIDHNKGSVGYLAGDAVRVMVRGRVFALAEEPLALGDTLFVRHTSGAGGTQKGALRNDADTATASTPALAKVFLGGALPVLQLGD